jgi:hypothetical protein
MEKKPATNGQGINVLVPVVEIGFGSGSNGDEEDNDPARANQTQEFSVDPEDR